MLNYINTMIQSNIEKEPYITVCKLYRNNDTPIQN